MSVITTQAASLIAATYVAAGAGAPGAVQAQTDHQAAPADWQAALMELDALLQAALPDAETVVAARSDTPQSDTPPSDKAPHIAVGQDMPAAPVDGLPQPQSSAPDLHPALRRIAQGASDAQKPETEAAHDDAPAAPMPAEVNTALLRQLNEPALVQLRTAARGDEPRLEPATDALAARGDRTRGAERPPLVRNAVIAQSGTDIAARVDSSSGVLRLEGLALEHPQALAVQRPNAPAAHEWAPLKLADQSAQWGRQLLDTLRERVEMQVNQQVKQAHIRLDPPELGRLELTVRLDGDHLSVQINANHAQLRDALLQTGERLRAALMPQHAGGVSVDVGQGSDEGRSGRPRGEQGILAGRRSGPEMDADLNELAPAGWLNTLV